MKEIKKYDIKKLIIEGRSVNKIASMYGCSPIMCKYRNPIKEFIMKDKELAELYLHRRVFDSFSQKEDNVFRKRNELLRKNLLKEAEDSLKKLEFIITIYFESKLRRLIEKNPDLIINFRRQAGKLVFNNNNKERR
jgi:hypothetical protein